MARLLLLTNDLAPSAEVVPALGLLGHPVRTLPADASALLDSPDTDVVLVDARRELPQARSLCRVIRATGTSAPVIAVLTEGGLIAVTAEWSVDDVVLDTAGPAEVDARLEPAIRSSSSAAQPTVITGWVSWIWATRAGGPMASPRYQAKKPRYMLTTAR